MLNLEHISIWELAHRWHEYDPNTSDPRQLPLEVQDTLRLITKAQHDHQLGICTPNGVELKNDRTLVRREDFRFEHDEKELTEDEKNDFYIEHSIFHSKRHNEFSEELPNSFRNREFDKPYLESIHITKPWTYLFCLENNLAMPAFWISESDIPELKNSWIFTLLNIEPSDLGTADDGMTDEDTRLVDKPSSIKQENIDSFWNNLEHKQQVRLLCRGAAKALWDKNPLLTIVEVSNDEALSLLGAKHYRGRDTIRSWIKDLDPRPASAKSGRPPKSK